MTDVLQRAHVLRIAGWGLAAAALLVPLVAMAFTEEVSWGPEDFLVAALLLGGAGVALEVSVRLLPGIPARIAAATVIAAAFVLVWAELAVGLFH
jgi:hypothetical protein